ncbi:MAG: radical SAM superfamily enzyme YgiQ (UPF0313 family) [Bacteriovoracaceae bacterium]|jgi:anaerobic magnesium-protoporphyrin IX monomethyl ester cyclase
MKKIVIIRTPFVFPVNHFSSITSVPDIGTAYINGTLTERGYDSIIIDAAGEGIGKRYQIKGTQIAIGGINADAIVDKVPLDVDYIGLQSMHSNRWIYDGYILGKLIEKFPNAKYFLGGEHVTATSEKILEQIPRIDACVVGEGEETVLELLHAFDNNLKLDNIKGISYVNNDGEIISTPRRKRQREVGMIPAPNWKGVPIQNYLNNNCGINSLARKSIPIIATRGCPYSCTFCTVPNMWDSKWYARDPHSVVAEIENYVTEFDVNHVDFVDLTLVINKKWMHNFCDALIAANLDITWAIPIGTRTETLDKELLAKMRKSGLSRVLYSAESGSKETLDRIKKCLKIEHFEEIVQETSKLGVCVKIALIFGFPGQTVKEVFDTFKLLNRLVFLGATDVVCLSFIPYPKTELFDQLDVEYDYTSSNNNIRLNNDIPSMKSWSEHFGDRTLRFFIWFFTLYFYALQFSMRPKRFFNFVYRVFYKRLPLTNFESIVFNMLNKEKIELETEDIGFHKSSKITN